MYKLIRIKIIIQTNASKTTTNAAQPVVDKTIRMNGSLFKHERLNVKTQV